MAKYSPPLAYWYLRKKRRGAPVDMSTIGPGNYTPTPSPPGDNPTGNDDTSSLDLSNPDNLLILR